MQSRNRRQFVRDSLLVGAGACFAGLGVSSAMAQGAHPLRLVLPLSAGSGVDAIARAASQALGDALGGRSVVVENLPGAGGVIGTQTVVRAAPDGNTLGFVSNNHVIFPATVKGLSFDPVADITPISIVCTSPLLLVTRPDLPVNNLRELAALLKDNPGKYNFGSSGNGTILHLAAEQFLHVTKTKSQHVPYRGTAPLIADVMGGQVDWAVIALPAIRGQLASGKLKALATTTPQRVASMRSLPTAVEQGFPDYVVEGWVGVIGPKGLSDANVKQIYEALKQAYSNPGVMEAMDKQGNIVTLMPPAEAKKYFASEMSKYTALAHAAGLTPS